VTAGNVRELLGERPALVAAAASGGGEFASFLSDLTEVVAQHLDAWRVRVAEAMTYWGQLGYDTAVLERALEQGGEPDVDELLERYEATIGRLRSLAEEASKFDLQLASSELFHDPERVGEAELVVARLAGTAEPPPAPSADLTRADFEVGSSNQLAAHAAHTIVEEPGRKYNPLFVHGLAGVGKTHLLHALGNELIAMSGGASVVACVNAQQFMDELIAALQEGSLERWRARYRAVDALIMDDVHLCAGTERTQEELFHIFNSLYASGRQVVLSADRPPREIERLEDRLRSRFEGGLVVAIQPPDQVLRERLYARCLAAVGVRPDRPLLEYLASRPAASVPEIAAVARRLAKAAGLVGVPLSASFAQRELEGGGAGSVASRTPTGGAADEFFLDDEKIVWDWPDVAGRAIEEFR
jgi:chromosomal replication initiator protein DnaA